jgi:hypothetical protein
MSSSTQEQIERLQSDLLAMRRQLQVDPIQSPADIVLGLVGGCSGLMILGLTFLTSLNPRFCVLLSVAPIFFLYVWQYFRTQRIRDVRPARAQEYRWSAIIALVLVVASAGWFAWARQMDISYEAASASIMFCLGVGIVLWGILDWQRRGWVNLVCGAVLAFLGVIIPMMNSRYGMAVLGGITVALVGFASSAIAYFKMISERSDEIRDAVVDNVEQP